MGIMRKIASISTLGMIDFRSDKERTARYTKQQMKMMKAEQKAKKDESKQE